MTHLAATGTNPDLRIKSAQESVKRSNFGAGRVTNGAHLASRATCRTDSGHSLSNRTYLSSAPALRSEDYQSNVENRHATLTEIAAAENTYAPPGPQERLDRCAVRPCRRGQWSGAKPPPSGRVGRRVRPIPRSGAPPHHRLAGGHSRLTCPLLALSASVRAFSCRRREGRSVLGGLAAQSDLAGVVSKSRLSQMWVTPVQPTRTKSALPLPPTSTNCTS